LRRTVRFAESVRTLLDAGHRTFVEVSSHPVLTAGVEDTVADAGERAVAVGTLRRDTGLRRVLTSVAEVFVRGVPVDWSACFANTGAQRVDLPTYAFQHERFWVVPALPEGADASDPPAAEFWAAVEQADLAALTSSLHVDEDSLAAVLPALSSWRRQHRDQSTVDSWRYRVRWKPLRGLPQGSLSGTWLVVSTE